MTTTTDELSKKRKIAHLAAALADDLTAFALKMERFRTLDGEAEEPLGTKTIVSEILKYFPAETVARLSDGDRTFLEGIELFIDLTRLTLVGGVLDDITQRVSAVDDITQRVSAVKHKHPEALQMIERVLLHRSAESTDDPVPQMEMTIMRLFAESPSPLGAGQAPAIEAAVLLRGMQSSFCGSLSPAPDGGLRILYPSGNPDGELIEQFFAYEDVVSIGVKRSVTASSHGHLIVPS